MGNCFGWEPDAPGSGSTAGHSSGASGPVTQDDPVSIQALIKNIHRLCLRGIIN